MEFYILSASMESAINLVCLSLVCLSSIKDVRDISLLIADCAICNWRCCVKVPWQHRIPSIVKASSDEPFEALQLRSRWRSTNLDTGQGSKREN
jgi:hypothetical protein